MGDGKRVTYDEALVVLPRSDAEALASFVDALLHRDARSAIMTIGDCLDGGVDLDQFATDAVELLRKTLLTRMSGNPDIFTSELDEEGKKRLEGWAALAEPAWLVPAIETLMDKRRDIKTSHPAQLPLELAAVRICEGLPSALEAAAAQGRSGNAGTSPAPRTAAVPARAADAVRGVAVAADDVAAKEAELASAAAVPVLDIVADGAETAPAAAVTTIEAIKARWKEFMEKAGEQNHGLLYLLGVGAPVEVAGKIVRIGFDFAFHKDKLNQEKNRRMIEKALAGIIGADVRVEGVLLEKKQGLVHDDAAPAEAVAAPVFEGNVLQAFGGRVVE
jgi:DNA polymerase III gamma/tau subunit